MNPENIKWCPKCCKDLPVLNFRGKLCRGKPGYSSYCIPCEKEYKDAWYLKKVGRQLTRNKRNTAPGTKRCNICKEVKLFSFFKPSSAPTSKYGCAINCIECQPKRNAKRRVKNPKKRTIYDRTYKLEGNRTCIDCNITDLKENFFKIFDKEGNIESISLRCVPCYLENRAKNRRKAYQADLEHKRALSRKYSRAAKDNITDTYLRGYSSQHWESYKELPQELLDTMRVLVALKREIRKSNRT